jgi:hypothetical protein
MHVRLLVGRNYPFNYCRGDGPSTEPIGDRSLECEMEPKRVVQ